MDVTNNLRESPLGTIIIIDIKETDKRQSNMNPVGQNICSANLSIVQFVNLSPFVKFCHVCVLQEYFFVVNPAEHRQGKSRQSVRLQATKLGKNKPAKHVPTRIAMADFTTFHALEKAATQRHISGE